MAKSQVVMKRNWYWFVIAGLIIALVWVLSKKPKSAHDQCLIPSKFPLKSGDEGEEVKRLQTYLNNAQNAGLELSGKMDAPTIDIIKTRLQRDSISLNYYVKSNMHHL